MKKKTKRRKIRYREPTMKYNVALHKFEPDLLALKKELSESKVEARSLLVVMLIILLLLAAILYLISQAGMASVIR